MAILKLVVAPLITLILLAIGYLYALGGSELVFTKKLIKWTIIFVLFCVLAQMFVRH